MSADLQFKQLIDRILRCREAEDVAKDDTKEVYAELKGLGYDKTAAGALVAEMRKRGKNPDQFEERGAVLDLYRDAYERAGGSLTHTHTRETNEYAAAKSAATEDHSATRNGANTEQGDVDGGAERADRAGHDFENALAGQVETRSSDEIVDDTASLAAREGDKSQHSNSPLPANVPQQADSAPEACPPQVSGATPFINPRCQHSETCHFADSRDCCHDCLMAWAQRPKDEQIRLWAEANDAARAA